MFGSVLRGDLPAQSDIDVMAVFRQSAHWDRADWDDMIDDAKILFDHEVHLVNRDKLPDFPCWQKAIKSRHVIFPRFGRCKCQ